MPGAGIGPPPPPPPDPEPDPGTGPTNPPDPNYPTLPCQGPRGPTGPTGHTGPDGGTTGPTGPDGPLNSILYGYNDISYMNGGILINNQVKDICNIFVPAIPYGVFHQEGFQKNAPLTMSFLRPADGSSSFVCDIGFTLTVTRTQGSGQIAATMDHIALYARLVDAIGTSLHGIDKLGGAAVNPHDQVLCLRQCNLSNFRQRIYRPGTRQIYYSFPDAAYDPPYFPPGYEQGDYAIDVGDPPAIDYIAADDGKYFVSNGQFNVGRTCYSFPIFFRLNCYYTVPVGVPQPVTLETMYFSDKGIFNAYINDVTYLFTGQNKNGVDGTITNMTAISRM